jgi:hypothetical protein
MMHGWYKVLDTAIPSATLKASLVKLCLDQSIAAPTLIASFFVVVGVRTASLGWLVAVKAQLCERA